MASVIEHPAIIKYPRQRCKIEHKLTDVLLLTICAVIAWSGKYNETPCYQWI